MLRKKISSKKNYIKRYRPDLYKNLFKKKLIKSRNVVFFDLFLKKIFSVLIYTGKKIKVIQMFLNWIKILKFLFFKKLKSNNLKKRRLALKKFKFKKLKFKKYKTVRFNIETKNKKLKFEKNKVKNLKINIKKIFNHSKIRWKNLKKSIKKSKNKNSAKKFKVKNKKFIKKFKNKNKKFIRKFKVKNKKFIKKFKNKNKKFIRKMKNERLIKKQKNKNKKLFFFNIYKLIFINRLHKVICPKIGYQSFFRRGVLNKMPSVTDSTLKDKNKAYTLVSLWLKKAIYTRKEKTFVLKFYSELFDINLKKGSTYKQKIEYYKVLYKNKKFYKFKKWI